MMKKFLFLLLTALLSTTLFQTNALAQIDDNSEVVEIDYDTVSLFPRNFYTVEMFNNPSVSESDFTLRIASYGVVSGCAEMTKSKQEVNEINDRIQISVKDSEIRVKKRQPRYTNYDCKTNELLSYHDVKFNRDDMIEKGIKKIALRAERKDVTKKKSYQDFGEIEILELTKEKIEFEDYAPVYGKRLVRLWFFPKNTVVLVAPNAKQGVDVKDQIRAYGEQELGLTSIEDRFEGFTLKATANNYVLFQDTNGNIVENLENIGEYNQVGNITLTRTVYGPNGAEEEPFSIPVMATLPGQN